MITKYDTLPDWVFVGGGSQEYIFTLRAENGELYNLPGATANIAIAEFTNPSHLVLSRTVDVLDEDGGINGDCCYATFPISGSETRDLSGRYIYQIAVKTADGIIAPPQRGRMYVTKNINGSFS